MKELIYSIKDIFNDKNQNGCLTQYDCKCYHIPAYQRGYKWASDSNGAVSILLNDLKNAFLSSEEEDRKEYYLQYITVKKNESEKGNYLEVIDGQQRLTTISIILSIISLELEKINIATDKLDYAIRSNFFTEYIYKKDAINLIIDNTWEQLLNHNSNLNKQDVYYICSAVKKSYEVLINNDFKLQLQEFYEYLITNVKIIVNSVEEHIESETVFKNLNSNKVPLTEPELIKGLLITKIGREQSKKQTKHFKEIMEIRMNIGRYWDEITAWANKPEIKSFYFNNKQDAMHELLWLTAITIESNELKLNSSAKSKDFPLFNYFLDLKQYKKSFDQLLKIKNTLDDWFYDTKIYNLLGFCRFSKSSGFNNLKFLKEILNQNTKTGLINELNKIKSSFFKDIDWTKTNYAETPNTIHHILLALNVFIEGQDSTRFNFYAFEQENWTLEHIFPQTPEGKKKILSKENRDEIIALLGDGIDKKVLRVLKLPERDEIQKELYYSALKEHPALNSIGNMCLLTGSDNASMGNKFFYEKRQDTLKLIQKGSFVPKHTFDVFSKMFESSNTDKMKVWTKKDIDEHFLYIKSALKSYQLNNVESNI
ncbi:DUF262 domain-containing protein [Tenacibaculum finnmarkense]|uniref:DUF262 domain-containing protein n=1 Tax=Tenacibaculum finnmarkense TaxID=2781243 RepID=UPI001EFB353A|nr:DUF262 domain-containing protein [Tenacibaculum finnmarkense]MCG8812160.1 DUF262 domain-containing protein [Tenacibaculum finnmarkense]